MVNIKLKLFIVLFLEINLSMCANLFDLVDGDDFRKCNEIEDEITSTPTNICFSVNSSLKLKEDHCCRISFNYDPLQELKSKYPEDWKKRASQKYGFDENLSEEEIRQKYVKNKKINRCSLISEDEDYKNYNLYTYIRLSYSDKITYNCGDGEKSYKTKDYKNYIPKQHIFKIGKDLSECLIQTNETDCHNSASKFLTDDVIACWNKVNYYESERNSRDKEECRGYQVSEYKTYFTNKFKSNQYFGEKVEETWNCVDKSGKKIQIYMNTMTGKLKIT